VQSGNQTRAIENNGLFYDAVLTLRKLLHFDAGHVLRNGVTGVWPKPARRLGAQMDDFATYPTCDAEGRSETSFRLTDYCPEPRLSLA
jgi:hypothetical protein